MTLVRTGEHLRILMVAPQPFFRARGTPFSVLHRIRALCSAGHEVDLVTYPFGEDVDLPGLRIIRAGRPPFVTDVKIGPSPAKLALDFFLFFSVVRLLRGGRYDVLHTHEEAAFFGISLARRYGLLHVYDMHSSLPQQLGNFSSYDYLPIRRIFDWLERRVLTSCNGVITICKELADAATAMCGDTPHALIENTAEDATVFGRSDLDVREAYGLTGRKIILYTGTFEAYQGIDLLLSAMRHVVEREPNARLVMVGGTPDQIGACSELARSLGIDQCVTFVGLVHPSRIPGFLAAADVIVSPRSHGTNTPLKIYGYLRSGKPLVATNILTHTQTLNDGLALLVRPETDDLADGIIRVLGDEALAKCLGRAGAEYAEQQFSDASYVRRVIEFYDAVLARAGQRTRLDQIGVGHSAGRAR